MLHFCCILSSLIENLPVFQSIPNRHSIEREEGSWRSDLDSITSNLRDSSFSLWGISFGRLLTMSCVNWKKKKNLELHGRHSSRAYTVILCSCNQNSTTLYLATSTLCSHEQTCQHIGNMSSQIIKYIKSCFFLSLLARMVDFRRNLSQTHVQP